MSKLYVIGIGYKPLDKRAREIIAGSQVILASKRLFEVFKGYKEYEAVKDKIQVINNVDETIKFIHSSLVARPSSFITLFASGDPTFFGIGRRAIREFGKDMVEIFPDLSSIQIAFSRIKESWDDAFLMSLHGGPDPEKRRRLPYEITDIPSLLQKYPKIAILTDKENNPSAISKVLILSPIAHSLLPVMYVCEKLGYPDEKITEGAPEEIAGMTFETPNVVIIKSAVSSQQSAVSFGLKENEIIHSRGLITKDEVRAVTIHRLRLPQRGVLWDIGAGSGSVSIEAARLYPELKVFAIEKNEEQIKNIKENRIKFDATNIETIKGPAPDVLINLPAPDRVFIGGSGGKLKDIIGLIAKMQTAIIVINAATVETLNIAVAGLQRNGFLVDVSQVSVSRMKKIGEGSSFSALNPVFVITGEKLSSGI
ncbi:MAG: precorrin-6y C5,15-methyltransferase (decarboxylating) subunit CbiE [Nitrospiraceae bacterium]|nr:MAG: precorrin-6y C5,15-methyltransferase (decarboxylating) subunit CbiE [Nitrospiraceae bacterium]